jgi:hypothetical protein
MNIVLSEQLEVTWWVLNAAAPTLCPIKFENLIRCRIVEVFLEANPGSIHVDAVVNIAFVFHADVLEKQWVDCAGMSVYSSLVIAIIVMVV